MDFICVSVAVNGVLTGEESSNEEQVELAETEQSRVSTPKKSFLSHVAGELWWCSVKDYPGVAGIFVLSRHHNKSLSLRAPKTDNMSFQPAHQTPHVLEMVAR